MLSLMGAPSGRPAACRRDELAGAFMTRGLARAVFRAEARLPPMLAEHDKGPFTCRAFSGALTFHTAHAKNLRVGRLSP